MTSEDIKHQLIIIKTLTDIKMCIAEYHSEAVRVENRRSQQCLPLCLCTERERETAKHAHAHIATYRRDPLGDTSVEARVPEERLNYQHVELSGKVSPLHRVYIGLWGVYLPTRAVVRPCGCFLVCWLADWHRSPSSSRDEVWRTKQVCSLWGMEDLNEYRQQNPQCNEMKYQGPKYRQRSVIIFDRTNLNLTLHKNNSSTQVKYERYKSSVWW